MSVEAMSEPVVTMPVGDLLALVEQAAERAAERVLAEVLRGGDRLRDDRGLVDAARLGRELGVSRAWVYEHAGELGAIRLGEGSKARLRFDVERARAALASYGSERSQAPIASAGAKSGAPAPRRRGSLATRRPKPGAILPPRPRRRKAAGS
jgi:hypothetical protein